MSIVARFAPSPTGRLHVGNARTALINDLLVRRHGGRLILRFDDTDTERCRDRFVEDIEADLAWMGLRFDTRIRQSARLSVYREALERLRRDGHVYACYETAEELEFKRRRQLARGLPPIYDRAGRALSAADRAALEAEGRRPYWRLALPEGEIAWNDLIRGPVRLRAETTSDPVLVRADGTFVYMLPSTVDDIDLGVTHVVRGEDHVPNTLVQIILSRLLGTESPLYAHLPLLIDRNGASLSKRLGSLTLRSLRERGIEPMPLNDLLARLGTGMPLEPHLSLDVLASEFDLSRLGRAAAKFDEEQLVRLNERYLQQLPYALAEPRLKAMDLDTPGEAFWAAIGPNLRRFDDAAYWHRVCFGEIAPGEADPDLVGQAVTLLPPEPWTKDTWHEWTAVLQERTGRRGREIYGPLRQALTGRSQGPELKRLLPLIGRVRTERRLRLAAAGGALPVDAADTARGGRA
jgi:glutamyl-tRNA synthetase